MGVTEQSVGGIVVDIVQAQIPSNLVFVESLLVLFSDGSFRSCGAVNTNKLQPLVTCWACAASLSTNNLPSIKFKLGFSRLTQNLTCVECCLSLIYLINPKIHVWDIMPNKLHWIRF